MYLRQRGGAASTFRPPYPLRKLALQRCELELLRSHPKDERGSVREIGLWIWMDPTLHFLELSPILCSFLLCCSECSFSGPFWDPETDRKWVPKWTGKGTENDPRKDTRTSNPEVWTRKLELETRTRTRSSNFRSNSNSNSYAKPS